MKLESTTEFGKLLLKLERSIEIGKFNLSIFSQNLRTASKHSKLEFPTLAKLSSFSFFQAKRIPENLSENSADNQCLLY